MENYILKISIIQLKYSVILNQKITNCSKDSGNRVFFEAIL